MIVTVPNLGPCKVLAIRPANTIDVESLATGFCYRISGLAHQLIVQLRQAEARAS